MENMVMVENMFIYIIIFIVIIAIILIYNSIIWAKNKVEENLSTIDIMFQQRYSLIPNLVNVVKQFAKHEKEVLENITSLRWQNMQQKFISKEQLEKENELSWTLKSIFALSESYPDLKSNENFMNLQNELSNIEDNLQASRRSYNSSVNILNDKKQMFPTNIVAMLMWLKDYPLFEANLEAKKEIKVWDLFNN